MELPCINKLALPWLQAQAVPAYVEQTVTYTTIS